MMTELKALLYRGQAAYNNDETVWEPHVRSDVTLMDSPDPNVTGSLKRNTLI